MKRLSIVAVALVLVALVVGSAFVYQNLNSSAPVAFESVTIGHVPIESFALLYVAQNEGFFTGNGLNVTIKDYSTGANAVDALTSGAIDLAGSSEYVVTLNAVEKQNISIIASLGETQIVSLIARKDHGITQPSDLRGKTVGTAKGVVAEFDLGRFLEANGMTIADINLVYFPPSQFAAAIGNGTLDAVASWQTYSEQVRMQLMSGFEDWPLQTDAPFFSVLSCQNSWLSSHSETATKLLTALSQAQDYLNNNPQQALQIVKNRFNYTDAYLTSVWGRNNCALNLNQKLLSVMTEEAAWMINNNLTTQKTLPNIVDYVDAAALKAVRPQLVTIP